MTYAEAVAYLDRFTHAGIKLGLERVQRLCAAGGHPERAFRSVLVGGTNGKGSVCTMLAAILEEAGLRVGLSPKPHLYDLRERFQVDGRMIEPEEFAALVANLAGWLEADPTLEPPTWFEAMTIIAFQFFARRRVDWAVVEVGLGGRFDATNVLDPELCLITNVTLDHTDRLGDTVEAIAFEKAGILKPGGSCITGASGPALTVIEQAAAERGVQLWRLGREISLANIVSSEQGVRFDVETPDGDLKDLHSPMLGVHQAANGALTAAAALRLRDRAPLAESAIRAGLARARIAGRLEVLRRDPTLLIDGAHNPDAARRLRETLHALFRSPRRPPGVAALLSPSPRRLILVLGALRTHPYAQVVDELAPAVDLVIATQPQHPQAVPAAELAERARALGTPAEVIEPVPAAVARALAEARPEDVICVTGSFYVLAEVPGDAAAG
jgi:dihydrofolate synthase/folylpolyglutamate synthase